MTRLDSLRKNYLRVCSLPWRESDSGPQRVYIALYEKEDERKLRFRLKLFEESTQEAGHCWQSLDLTDAFPQWMCGPDVRDYAESYFESPELLDDAALADFKQTISAKIVAALVQLQKPFDTVLAVIGVGSLFGCVRMSEILPQVEGYVKGRLLIFFPGTVDNNNYRLLDAQDGWNYHAVPISAGDAEARR